MSIIIYSPPKSRLDNFEIDRHTYFCKFSEKIMSNLSCLGKRWVLLNRDHSQPILNRLLANRGIVDTNKINEFLNPSLKGLHDPFLMGGMQKAVNRIKKAIANQERIIIYGDYDVDGVTGTAILVLVLQELGAEVSYRLPNRQGDGYGLSTNLIDELKTIDTKLLITVDCGISCINEISYAKKLNIDSIITDHHSIPGEIPECEAILHPKLDNSGYPFMDLTGAGVALKLAQALSPQIESFAKFIDLACLGTIADLGPLLGENRIIVKEGLNNMHNTYWDGLKHLLKLCNLDPENEIQANHIGFRIAPRINAAGRLESAYYALKLFLTQGATARRFADRLEKINKERQRLTEVILQEAVQIIEKQINKEKLLIAYHPSWHSGLVGIIAGKLSGMYGRPVIIMEERNDTYIGSARGPSYYNLVDALQNCQHLLASYGGHHQAAGFTLKENMRDEFVATIQAQARENLNDEDQTPTLPIDTEIQFSDINHSLIDIVNSLRPYGMANERPAFLIKGAILHSFRKVGADQTHLLGQMRLDQSNYKFIAFSLAEKLTQVNNYTRADIVCHIDVNTYKGGNRIEFQLLDLKLT